MIGVIAKDVVKAAVLCEDVACIVHFVCEVGLFVLILQEVIDVLYVCY